MNKKQQLLSKVKHNIVKNCKEEIINFYGDLLMAYYDIDEYLLELEDTKDKISVAQWANHYEKVHELVNTLQLTDDELEIYNRLKEKNVEIDETINFEILSPKYAFLEDMLDMITTDTKVQDQILSLSNEMLEVFKLLYNRINETSDYTPPYISAILDKIGYVSYEGDPKNNFHYYDELNEDIIRKIKEGYTFTDHEIDMLLFIYTNSVGFTVRNMEDVRNFGNKTTEDQLEIDEIINNQRNKEQKEIDKIKFALLLKTYGIGLETAKSIISKYQLTKLTITEENKHLFEMYKAILQIVNEKDADKLIRIYDAFSKELDPKLDYRRIMVFTNELRKEFARSLNNEVYKIDDKKYTLIDGIKVYDAGVDFKMIITAIGAYQGKFQDQEDYRKYWNSPYIRSHGNCCSLIGNNNLSTATVRNVILGFSTMNENMLLLSSDRDLDSTPDTRSFNPIATKSKLIFTSGDELIDNTRGDYNELVYERRDLSSNPKFYKKNPDYIVFIEEYEDIDRYIEFYSDGKHEQQRKVLIEQKEEQDRMWRETLKAANNFGVPIVKINRERCAKSEKEKIDRMIEEFEQTKDPQYIYQIITQFHNNRFGNKEKHPLITNVYFSKKIASKYLERIDNAILSVDDIDRRMSLINTYQQVIETEYKKIDYYRYIADTKKLSGIDFVQTRGIIESLKNFTNLGEGSPINKRGK